MAFKFILQKNSSLMVRHRSYSKTSSSLVLWICHVHMNLRVSSNYSPWPWHSSLPTWVLPSSMVQLNFAPQALLLWPTPMTWIVHSIDSYHTLSCGHVQIIVFNDNLNLELYFNLWYVAALFLDQVWKFFKESGVFSVIRWRVQTLTLVEKTTVLLDRSGR